MDNLFANIGANLHRESTSSANNLEFINNLALPSSDINLGFNKDSEKQRRVSAPSVPFLEKASLEPTKKDSEDEEKALWIVNEEEDEEDEMEKERARRKLLQGAIRTSLVQSHSMDDLKQIEDDSSMLQLPKSDFQNQLMSLKVSSE